MPGVNWPGGSIPNSINRVRPEAEGGLIFDERRKTEDTRYKIQDTRQKTQDERRKTKDTSVTAGFPFGTKPQGHEVSISIFSIVY